MQLTFSGTGTSHGIPMIACDCPVCRSGHPRNTRRRSSLWVRDGETSVVVDTPPDFREQALTFGLRSLSAVFYTHAHADHVFGFDDIRRFSSLQKTAIPVYAGPHTLDFLKRTFAYVMKTPLKGTTLPHIDFRAIDDVATVGGITVRALPVEHGQTETFGYLFETTTARAAYVPDCHRFPDATRAQLGTLDVMILDALRDTPHPTHLTVDESVRLLQTIGARQSYITHLGHDLDHDAVSQRLPKGIACAYDGLVLDLP